MSGGQPPETSGTGTPYPTEPEGGWRTVAQPPPVPAPPPGVIHYPEQHMAPSSGTVAALVPIRNTARASLAVGAVYTGLVIVGAVMSWRGTETTGVGRAMWQLNVLLDWPWAGAAFVVSLALWIITCSWLSTARRNSELLSITTQHARAGQWVWLGWIVPIVQFWFPYQVVRDILKASHRGIVPAGLQLPIWWACWLAPMFIPAASTHTRMTDGVVTEFSIANPYTSTLNALITVAAFVLWWRIVHAIIAAQDGALSEAASLR